MKARLFFLTSLFSFCLCTQFAFARNLTFQFASGAVVELIRDPRGVTFFQNGSSTYTVTHNEPIIGIHAPSHLNPQLENTLLHMDIRFLPAQIHMINKNHSPLNVLILETPSQLLVYDTNSPRTPPTILIKDGYVRFSKTLEMSLSFEAGKGGVLSMIYEDAHNQRVLTRTSLYSLLGRPFHLTMIESFYSAVKAMSAPGDMKFPLTRISLETPIDTLEIEYDYANNKLREIGRGSADFRRDEDTQPQRQKKQVHHMVTEPPRGLGFQSYLADFEKSLNERILGQPEAIDALMSIEMQNLINGENRSKPEILMLMGLPGTGKDTSVESYIATRFKLRHPEFTGDPEDHIFRFPVIKEEKEVWSIQGSGTGYVGSGKLSAFNRFLVLHSGGRYQIIEEGDGPKKVEYVIENPEWKPGTVLPGYFAPEDAIVYINELHDWSKEAKNRLLKEFLEKGFAVIGDPGSGIARLQVPANIILASNHGISLITARDQQGQRVGAPLNFQEMMERWMISAKDFLRLQDEIAKPTPSNPEGGLSDELKSRIPKQRIVLLRPMSPETLLEVIKLKLKDLKDKFLMPKKMEFPRLNLEFSNKLKTFLAEYDQTAEDGARPLSDKMKDLVDDTLTQALRTGTLAVKDGDTVKLDVKRNADGTYDLLANGKYLPIPYTQKEKAQAPVSDEEIQRLMDMEGKMNARAKGLGAIVSQLVGDLITSVNEEKKADVNLEKKPADVYAFFGVSSTGKTELGKVFHQIFFQTNSDPLIIDFGQIRTTEDLKTQILGTRNAIDKEPIASVFMEHYDRASGKLVVVLDEFSNANPEVLKALYDILREPVVRTFSDRKPRPMRDVKIILTGNVGEEWYASIPREIPEAEQYQAARDIYAKAMQNEGFRRTFLLKKFSEALVNRIGDNRTFWFAPHTKTTIRELIQMKLLNALKGISTPVAGKRTWDIKFQSAQDYEKTIQAIETYGFKIWEQGASITKYVDDVLIRSIKKQLLTNKVPSGAAVTIIKTRDKNAADASHVGFELQIQSNQKPWGSLTLNLQMPGKGVVRQVRKNPNDLRLTAYHEAGHEVVRRILLGDKQRPGGVSILPGVTEINGEWIQYNGVARSEEVESMQRTREVIIAEIAVLAGGEAGELLTTKELRHTAGKVNDMQRATKLARSAILRWGFSEKWGRAAVGDQQNMDLFISSLSEKNKQLLEREVNKLIEEGRALAKKVLIANYDTLFIPIGNHLAKSGEISGATLQRFYEQRQHLEVHPEYAHDLEARVATFDQKVQAEPPPHNKRDYEFFSFLPAPSSIADVEKMMADKQAKEVAGVDLSPGQKFVRRDFKYSSYKPSGPAPVLTQLFKKMGVESAANVSCRIAHKKAAP